MSMATTPKVSNQGNPFHGDPYTFPCFRNVGPPYIATLSHPRFIMGLSIWFFSTLMVSNSPDALSVSPPPQKNQPHVDPFPSSPIDTSSLSSSLSSESLDPSN